MTTTRKLFRRPKGLKPPVRVPEPQEIAALFGAFSSASAGTRDRAIAALLYRAGLRIQEALDLELDDIDLRQGLIRIRSGKGGKARTATIDAGAAALVQLWVERRAKLGLTRRHPLFATFSKGAFGARVDQRCYRAALKRVAARVGLADLVHPHALRHTYAVELENEGIALSGIQEALGHSNARTTDIYLRRHNPQRHQAHLRERPWPVAQKGGAMPAAAE
jgi:integrase/recombinase XerC